MSVDLSALAAAQRVASTPPPPITRPRHVNPFGRHLRESFERGGVEFELPPIPRADVQRVCAAIRRAAESVGLGSSVRRRDIGDMVAITYWATVRRAYRRASDG